MENIGTMIGPKGMIKKYEFVRIITQCLYSLGYKKTAACLELASCISCKAPELESIESHVLNGDWHGCLQSLAKIDGLTDETKASAMFFVLEQHLLESLNGGDISSALDVLWKQIPRLKIGKEKVHELSYELFSSHEFGLGCIDTIHEWRKSLLVHLERVLPQPITLHERRLEHLIEMAICAQIDGCIYHSSSNMISLYRDHHYDRDQFPTETIQAD